MPYTWGRDIVFKWFPQLDNVQCEDFPSQTPTIYVFHTESMPTQSAARAGTGANQTISSWSSIPGGFQFTISAIPDPDPNSATQRRVYWVAINFVLKTGGQVQCVIEPLEMLRLFGQQSKVDVTIASFTASYPEIAQYVSPQTLTEVILEATEIVRIELMSAGFNWAQIKRPDLLSLLVKTRAKMSIEMSQRQAEGDKFDLDFKQDEQVYKLMKNGLKLEYDANQDNVADSTEKNVAAGGYVMAVR